MLQTGHLGGTNLARMPEKVARHQGRTLDFDNVCTFVQNEDFINSVTQFFVLRTVYKELCCWVFWENENLKALKSN